MVFKKKNQLVGLDIGTRALKVSEIAETGKGHLLRRFGILDIPPGLIEGGEIKDIEKLAESVKHLFQLYNIKEKNVALSLGGTAALVKKITMQKMAEEDLQKTIHFEAEQHIPQNIEDVNIDFQIMEENESNPNVMNVLLVSAKHDMINDYINLARMAGLNPCILDVDTFALQNIYEFNQESEEDTVVLVDIGAVKTSLNIVKGTTSLLMRDVLMGCSQVNEKLMTAVECSFDDAEEIKFDPYTDKIPVEELNRIVAGTIAEWAGEIRLALDFYYTKFPEDPISRVLLSGGGANIEQFRDLLMAETSLDVEVFNPFNKLYFNDDRFDGGYLRSIAPQAAVSMGLALRRVDDK